MKTCPTSKYPVIWNLVGQNSKHERAGTRICLRQGLRRTPSQLYTTSMSVSSPERGISRHLPHCQSSSYSHLWFGNIVRGQWWDPMKLFWNQVRMGGKWVAIRKLTSHAGRMRIHSLSVRVIETDRRFLELFSISLLHNSKLIKSGDWLWLIISRYSASEGHTPCSVQCKSKLCPMNRLRSSSITIPMQRGLFNFWTSFMTSMSKKLALFIVEGAPNTVWVAGWPRRRSEESSMSSSLCQSARNRHWLISNTYIRDELCSFWAMILIVCTIEFGSTSQTLRASIRASRTPLEGRELMYLKGACKGCDS